MSDRTANMKLVSPQSGVQQAEGCRMENCLLIPEDKEFRTTIIICSFSEIYVTDYT
jgi:hypothetical protein